MIRTLDTILHESSSRHKHLCPRQVLGARIGLYAAELLALDLPRKDKRLLVIAETDGCFADGVDAATGCTVGHRTLRIEDYGKVAATFVDVSTGETIRLAPRFDIRERAFDFAPDECRHYHAQLRGYQTMPPEELFLVQAVELKTPLGEILSRPSKKAICETCGEEIINGREIMEYSTVQCRACAGEGYYYLVPLSQYEIS